MNNFSTLLIDNHFSKELPQDSTKDNYTRQVYEACYSLATPKKVTNPELVHASSSFLEELGIDLTDSKKFLEVVSGQVPFKNFTPYAMCYGGHQFGNWAGQLGDGRAINIAEVKAQGKNWTLQLKGAGPTPYSRGSDGLAVLRSSIREYLCSEAMHHLGVPTTRALSLVKTGEWVTRDMLYDGNPEDEHGAIVCRVSPSFIRFGSFELFTSRQDIPNLKKLVEFTLRHHYPHLGEPSKETYLAFFKEVASKTKDLMIHWQRVGFVHGVMNTDNMSILGLTIDYGPYGWLEDYNPYWTPNTTDAQHKRYRYGQQASVALWNLTQLANALYPLIEEVEPLQEILEGYKVAYSLDYHKMMGEKLGLYQSDAISEVFFSNLEENLTRSEIDFTLFYRELSDKSNIGFPLFWKTLGKASYLAPSELEKNKENWQEWYVQFSDYLTLEDEDSDTREANMKATNPKYVLRNYMAQLAIDAAEKGDYTLVDELYSLLLTPYEEQPDLEKWYAKRPEWAKHKVGCSMLSCSS